MSRKPEAWAVLGARGSGKSAWCKQQLARLKPRRLAVWDFMREHDGQLVTSQLGEALRAMSAPAFNVVFRPSLDDKTRARQFELWCLALRSTSTKASPVLAHVEELAFVTSPFKAPPAWRQVSLLGRHDGLSVIGTSQRPASIDKDFLGQCDLVHTGRLSGHDAKAAATVLGVDAAELIGLADLAWVERRAGETSARRGTLSFGLAATASVKKPKARNSTAV